MINYGVFWGYRYFRKPPCSKQIGTKVGLVARCISILHHVSSRTTSFAFGSPGQADSAAHLGFHDSRLRENMSQMPSNCKQCFGYVFVDGFNDIELKRPFCDRCGPKAELICLHKMVRLYPNVASWRGAQLHSCSPESSDLWGPDNFFPWKFLHVSIHTCWENMWTMKTYPKHMVETIEDLGWFGFALHFFQSILVKVHRFTVYFPIIR